MANMYHIFFIHSSLNGFLDCFHILAIINVAAMNIVSLWIMFVSTYVPRSGIAEPYGSSHFSFKGTSILFSIVAISIYIPTNSVGGFSFLHILSSVYCL